MVVTNPPETMSQRSVFQRLLLIWAVGFIARAVYAMLAPGFHARDDYFHVLAPALEWLDNPAWNWTLSGTPGAGIRSHLLPKIVQGLLASSADLGPLSQLRVVGVIMAAWSSLIVPFSWPLIRALAPTKHTTQLILLWLLSLHPALIYGAPKLLIEVQCIPMLMGALSLMVTSRRDWHYVAAGACFGGATYIRYQTLTAASAAVAFLLASQLPASSRLKKLACMLSGTGFAIVLGGWYDLLTDGRFLGPLIQNIAVNLTPPDDLTRSSSLTYVGTILVLLCPWVLHRIQWREIVRNPAWLCILTGTATFVVAHSLTPHKEERFLFPVVGLIILIAGTLWTTLDRPRLRLSLFVYHIVLLVVLFGINPQQATREALAQYPSTNNDVIVSLGPEVQSFFIRPKTAIIERNRKFDPTWVGQQVTKHSDKTFFVLSYKPQREAVLLALKSADLMCDAAESFDQNWADSLAYKLNPRHNLRRSTIETRICSVQ